jgi:uncharacterized membrane protein
MIALLYVLAFLSLLSSGAIFGFFYAWVCSTMWGLDAADPAVAIQAMQAMNASVRNVVFAPAFFGTPVVLLAAAVLAFTARRPTSAIAFGAAAFVYLCGGLIVTMVVNVPMNEALAAVDVKQEAARLEEVWRDYSLPWQFWNTVRAIASGVALLLTGVAISSMKRGAPR